MEGPGGLYGMQIVAGLLRLLRERDPHPVLFNGIGAMLDWLDDPGGRRAADRAFPVEHFGPDFEECAATGSTPDLIYGSPKGREV